MPLALVSLPLLLLLTASAAWFHGSEAPPAPRQANITAACTPGGQPGVHPPSIAMARADHIEWRSVSPRAVSWTITPKDPDNWPFEPMSFTGTPASPAVTPPPLPEARLHHVYAYNVTVVCRDGTSQVIDPEIIIGE